MLRKLRTREHVIADLSVNHVERFVYRCGWTVERVWHDYGADLIIRTYRANGEIEVGEVTFQLKASDSLLKSAAEQSISIRLEWRDRLLWLNEAMPVVLVAFDATSEMAYWLNIQEYFRHYRWARRAKSATTITVHIPIQNVLSEDAVRLFARWRDERMTKIEELIP